MKTCINSLICFAILMTANVNIRAQSKRKQTENRFAGTWLDKKTSRCLEISFQDGYATIIDWTSKVQKQESGDVYKAYLKNGKLIMPEDKEHHAPYSEIIANKNTLIYLTKPMTIAKNSRWDKQVFTRSPNTPHN